MLQKHTTHCGLLSLNGVVQLNHLFGARPSPEPLLTYFRRDPHEKSRKNNTSRQNIHEEVFRPFCSLVLHLTVLRIARSRFNFIGHIQHSVRACLNNRILWYYAGVIFSLGVFRNTGLVQIILLSKRDLWLISFFRDQMERGVTHVFMHCNNKPLRNRH